MCTACWEGCNVHSTRGRLQTLTTNPGNFILRRFKFKRIKAKQVLPGDWPHFETWSRRSGSLAVIRPISRRKPCDGFHLSLRLCSLTELELIGHFVPSKLSPISHQHNKVTHTAGLNFKLCHDTLWHNHTTLSMRKEIEQRSARWVLRGNLTSWAPCQNLHNHNQSSALCKFNQSGAMQPATRLRTDCQSEPCW